MAESGGICEYNACGALYSRLLSRLGAASDRHLDRGCELPIGTLLSLMAVGVVLLVFSTADRRVAVLQVVRDLPRAPKSAPTMCDRSNCRPTRRWRS